MKLKELKVNAGGNIHPGAPVIIDFSESKFVKLSGDNGVGKTTLIEALLMACGQLGGKAQLEKFTNKESGKIDIEFSFVGKDRLNYDVKVTKSTFKLLYEGELVPEPITKMKELLGVVGVSPMEIKDRPLKEIIKWLASYSTKSPEEYENQMDKLKKGIKESTSSRADANRTAKGLREYLSGEGYISADGELNEKKWKESEVKFKTPIDTKTLSAKLDTAGKESDKLLQAETKLKQYKETKARLSEQISQLQAQLAETEKGIKGGEKYIEDNKGVRKEYDDIKKQYDNAATESVNYNKWKDVQAKKKELDQFETAAQKFDDKEKDLLRQVKELQLEILPDIKGVRIIMEDTHEDGKMLKEALYIGELTSAQVSETEWWEFILQMWKKNKTKIVVIDNFQSLGSKGVERLEALKKDGATIMVAEMNRAQKELALEYQ